MDRTYRNLDGALFGIQDADLLLFRSRSLISRAIQVGGRSPYSHAAMVAWWNSCPFVCEAREWHGIRAVPLQLLVDQYPGRIDLYEAGALHNGDLDRSGAVEAMQALVGRPYGYASVCRSALLHTVFLRWLVRPNTDDTARTTRPPFCSEAYVHAIRVGGGVDPVPNLADHETEPGDLARSPFFRYRFTFLP